MAEQKNDEVWWHEILVPTLRCADYWLTKTDLQKAFSNGRFRASQQELDEALTTLCARVVC